MVLLKSTSVSTIGVGPAPLSKSVSTPNVRSYKPYWPTFKTYYPCRYYADSSLYDVCWAYRNRYHNAYYSYKYPRYSYRAVGTPLYGYYGNGAYIPRNRSYYNADGYPYKGYYYNSNNFDTYYLSPYYLPNRTFV
ncbi:unnamed protein product [Bursaphelenchus okinawaensis]|uniref:Uncharacterized protein n=1 Tax=Bursaphelenchus okinawaensis TaxID=465554 RepID=A0A811KJT2_9BILA|nr:unnamed protein product [Bursaphelenchus okinawaensis]CAG9104397.1 unnamed protein product [Bursaphelenchus okinawaensis]